MKDKHFDGLVHLLRGRVYDEDMVVDIQDFYINDLKDNKFVSTYKNREFCVDDFIYFILPKDVFKSIYQDAFDKGFEEGKKINKKVIKTEE